jgi:hypothetical protein
MKDPGRMKPDEPVVAGAPVVGPKTSTRKLYESSDFSGRSMGGKGKGSSVKVTKPASMAAKRR